MSYTVARSAQRSGTPRNHAKRVLDMFVAALALTLGSPLLLAVAAAVKITSPGPVIFKRVVVGQYGRPFTAYKFRTMSDGAHDLLLVSEALRSEYEATLKVRDDPRVTPLGRWLRATFLDELPQLLNVIRGEMSIVGPRMLGDIELAKYGAAADTVLAAKPGITGLWQVSGRHLLSFEERVRLDLEYVARRSMWLDVVIILKTVTTVLGRRGV